MKSFKIPIVYYQYLLCFDNDSESQSVTNSNRYSIVSVIPELKKRSVFSLQFDGDIAILLFFVSFAELHINSFQSSDTDFQDFRFRTASLTNSVAI